MRVLVTGGAGFIGSHLAERLLDSGHQVRVLDNFATGKRENLLGFIDDVEIVEGDIQSYERVSTAVRRCDFVLHQAALPSVPRSVQDPLTSNAVNVVGTLNVLLASRDEGVGRVVFASSSSIYGANPKLPKQEEDTPLPMSPYAVAKLAGEAYCRSFHQVFGLDTVALRYFNVFGPRQDPFSQYAAVIPNFINALLRGDPPAVYGDGEQTRDFTYVENVVNANMLAMAADGVAGEAFNVAAGKRLSLNRLLHHLGDVTGTDVDADYQQPRPGEVRHSQADVSRAEQELGYRIDVPVEQGLRRTFGWHEGRLGTADVGTPR